MIRADDRIAADPAEQTLRRTLDATFLNRVANDPSVRPHVGGVGELDLREQVARLANHALTNASGGFLFEYHEPGRYELHTLFLPAGRGASVLRAAAEAFRYMFTRTDCVEIVTKVPASNAPADFMARRAGLQPIFQREAAWADGSTVTFFALSLDGWQARDPELVKAGRAFHDMLDDAKREAGSDHPSHPEDEAHNRAVGAASLMAQAGQHRKAVWSYNRWARFAGYQAIELLSDLPPVIDVRDAIITVAAGGLEVVQCR